MALQGTIDTFPLADVLRLLGATAKVGELRVDLADVTASLWFDAGAVVAAALVVDDGTVVSDDAASILAEALRHDAGTFVFEPDLTCPTPGAPVAVEDLVAEAEAVLTDWMEIIRVVPSVHAWVRLRTELPEAEVVLDGATWQLVVAIGSGGPVTAVAEALGIAELDGCRAVKALVEAGLAEVVAEQEPEEPEELDLLDEQGGAVDVPVTADDAFEEPFEAAEAFAAPVEPVDQEAQTGDEGLDGFRRLVPAGDVAAAWEREATPEPAGTVDPVFEAFESFEAFEADFGDPSPDAAVVEPHDALRSVAGLFGGAPLPLPVASFEPESLADALGGFDGISIPGFDERSFGLDAPAAFEEGPVELPQLTPQAARAIAAAAQATTVAERDAHLAGALDANDEPIDRGLLLRFLASVQR